MPSLLVQSANPITFPPPVPQPLPQPQPPLDEDF
jgi:hypothetical protein